MSAQTNTDICSECDSESIFILEGRKEAYFSSDVIAFR